MTMLALYCEALFSGASGVIVYPLSHHSLKLYQQGVGLIALGHSLMVFYKNPDQFLLS